MHGDGTLPVIPIERMSSAGGAGVEGAFGRRANRPAFIKLNSAGTHKEFTLAHEIGHFLDFAGIGKAHVYASEGDAIMDDFIAATDASDSIVRLRAALNKPTLTIGPKTLPVNKPVREHLLYLLRPREIWARAYSQYIAVRGGDPQILTQLIDGRKTSYAQALPGQWSDADFAPIEKAIEALLEKLQWTTKPAP